MISAQARAWRGRASSLPGRPGSKSADSSLEVTRSHQNTPPAPVFTLPGQINPFLEKPTAPLLLFTC